MFAKGVMQLLAEKKNPFHFSKSHKTAGTLVGHRLYFLIQFIKVQFFLSLALSYIISLHEITRCSESTVQIDLNYITFNI